VENTPAHLLVEAPPKEDSGYLKQYNEVLIRKLETKMQQLEEANRKLERDVAERQRTEEALRRSEAEFREAQRIAQLGSWTWEAASDTVNWSEEIYRIFGRDPKLPAPPVAESAELFTSESWARLRAAQQETLAHGTPYLLDLEVVRPDGTRGWMIVRGQAERDGSGQVTKLRGTTQDITDRKNAEQSLARRTQDLERSNADLEQFAYVASHDLKEPLRAVSGSVGMLQRHYEGKLDDLAGACISHAVEGTVRMACLIDGLLAYSRVDRRGGDFYPVECAQVLEAALQNLAATIQETGAVVTQDALPAVHGDASQLVSLFQNLVNNSLKFRREAPPRIHVSAERQGAEWHFAVRDNGIGIDPQFFGKLFRVFQRLHTRSQYPGTGIGLALCKKIVERHGGRIWVESALGEGTTFYFSLLDAQADHRRPERGLHAERRHAA
jgi:PAS domain S-box-containing protein